MSTDNRHASNDEKFSDQQIESMTALQSPLSVEVATPSRLHFGLFSFGHRDRRQFGGVGVMVREPQLRIRLTSAVRFCASGAYSERIDKFVERWCEFRGFRDRPRCHIETLATPGEHVGLGLGTQLGLSVAAGLSKFCRQPMMSAVEMAQSVGRGLRSAVGTYGFVHGGLIVERGKLPNETIAPLDSRIDIPTEWKWVLIRPNAGPGLSGGDEQAAFDRLPPVPIRITEALIAETRDRMLPAATSADFESFSQSVTRYGRLAGQCFSETQGGTYNGARLAALVELVKSLGVSGVGQSSWGPTLFAILPNLAAAGRFVEEFRVNPIGADCRITVTSVDNSGARICRQAAADERFLRTTV